MHVMATMVGTVIDPLVGRIFPARITWAAGFIVAVESVGDDEAVGKPFLMPGFVDSHVHVESSMVPPVEFARTATAHGTISAVSDPHEIANVLGLEGVEFMLDEASRTPFRFCFGAPSCVPATGFETSGATLGPNEVSHLLARPDIGYLAEVMNYPGVIAGDVDLSEKIRAARELGKPVDGHCPGLRGADLSTYVAAGISTDHECSALDEAMEKIALGMRILIREGSAARNFQALLPLLISHPELCMFCSDDKHPDELVTGHINHLVARAVEAGFDLLTVLRVACVNPALHYRLPCGLLRIGDPADFLVVESLRDFSVRETWIGGECVAREGESLLGGFPSRQPNRFCSRRLGEEDFRVSESGRAIRVIEVDDGEIVTRAGWAASELLRDPEEDLLKLCVVNRYHEAPPAMGFVRNFGLRRGAMASTVAHDCHNIVAVGRTDRDICRAVNALMECRGGCVVVDGDRVEILPLPIAGLMSPDPAQSVAESYSRLTAAARTMGSSLQAPFMTLSFLALLVIPELKLSDRGLFDGRKFEFVPVFDDF
jgi:adenine deaminase